MKITKFAVSRPIATLMFFLCFLLISIVSFMRLPVDFMPKIEAPVVSIITFWPGSSTEDMEIKVTKIIENNLSITNNLDEITSTTKEGICIVTCIFQQEADLNEASNEIRDKLEFAKPYMPSDISNPALFKFNTANMPIVFFGITAKENWDNLYDLIDDEVVKPLKRLDGVGAVQLIGGMKKRINVKIDRDKLAEYHLSIEDLERNIISQNLSLPAGTMNINDKDYLLRIPAEYKNIQELENVFIKQVDSKVVTLKDIAEVEDGFNDEKFSMKINGDKGLMLLVQKRSGANTIDVVRKVSSSMKKLAKKLPPDVMSQVIMDSSEFIKLSIKNLAFTAFLGIFFVALITLIFFKNMRMSAIILLSIPFSLMISFIFIYFFDWSINIMSLAALAIATGMVVDNTIVIIDSIMAHLKKGEKAYNACVSAAKDVGLAISASTLTTIVVFLPLAFLKGITGIMFRQLGGIITITLVASLICALMMVPMLSVKFIKLEKVKAESKILKKLEDFYSKILNYALLRRKRIIFLSVAFFISSIFLLPFIGTEFMPEEDSGNITVTLEMPVGTVVDKTEEICAAVEKDIMQIIGEESIVHHYYLCGMQESGFSALFNKKEGSHIGQIGCQLVKQKQRDFSSKDIAKKISDYLHKYTDIEEIDVDAENPMNKSMFGGGKPITINIYGHDLSISESIGKEVKNICSNIDGTRDVAITRDLGKPELLINIDRQRAAAMNLDIALIANSFRKQYQGTKTINFHKNEKEYDVVLKINNDQRKSLDDVMSTTVKSPYTTNIPLINIADIQEHMGPVEIERKDQERVLHVEMNIFGRAQGEIIKEIKSKIDRSVFVPDGFSINFGGMAEEQAKSFRFLLSMLLTAILLVYLVMAAQFESFKEPFIIMLSIPFALSGVFISLLITKTSLNAISFIGIIMLMGIIVNNAIVLIDCINQIRRKNISLKEAIVTSGKMRIRPVLITSLTTICGMLALVFSSGEGSEIWKPLGVSVAGGLTFSTLITLILIPVLYMAFENKKDSKKTNP